MARSLINAVTAFACTMLVAFTTDALDKTRNAPLPAVTEPPVKEMFGPPGINRGIFLVPHAALTMYRASSPDEIRHLRTPGLGKCELPYTLRRHRWENWQAACVSLPVKKQYTGGLTPLRSPKMIPSARNSTATPGHALTRH